MVSALVALCLLKTPAPWIEAAGIRLGSGAEPLVLTGDSPRLRVRGLSPGEWVTLHAFRPMSKQTFDAKGKMALVNVPMHAWATFRANRKGEIDADAMRPERGSYRSANPQGLFWSGYPVGDPAIPVDVRRLAFAPSKPSARVFLSVEDEGRVVASGTLALTDEAFGTVFESVDEPGLNGVFAYPKGARALPTVISLHGSEGGSAESARFRAAVFAARGYATFALNYFAYDYEPIKGVPTANIDTPVEDLERARAGLAKRPECDTRRLALEGMSKGAEFALVGAATYAWVKAIVAVVPSDVVWEGYGGPPRPEGTSSWSLGGKPLPYVPLYGLDSARFRLNTDRYEASRRDHPKEAKAAEIPIERSKAHFLLLGSERDETWASGRMIRLLAARLPRKRVKAIVFPKAGHQISGTGTFPPRLYGVPSEDPRDKDLTAEGAAAEESWRRTVVFLKRNL